MYSEAAALDRPQPASASGEFAPTALRYIKLGAGGAWTAQAFDQGIIPIGFSEVPHALCSAADWEVVKAHLREHGYRPSTASHWTRELRDFYERDEHCLWITIADGHLHWASAEREVVSTPNSTPDQPQRHRRTIAGWHRHDLAGAALTTRSLSSALLRTASYQMTICKVEQEQYLYRRIRGESNPKHIEATALLAKMSDIAAAMIQQLDWRDFETLTDLIFSRGGWQRGSALGEGEVDNDLLLTLPTTGETAWVQVKSKATQAVFDDYLARFDRDGTCQRFFFVCHSPKGTLAVPDRANLHLWAGPALARATIAAGLFDWLVDRTR